MTDEQQLGAEAPAMDAAAALDWLDTAIGEFFGATDECARHIAEQAGRERAEGDLNMTLETSARLNTFMLKLMEIAQHGATVQQQQPAPPLEQPEPEPEPEPEVVPGG